MSRRWGEIAPLFCLQAKSASAMIGSSSDLSLLSESQNEDEKQLLSHQSISLRTSIIALAVMGVVSLAYFIFTIIPIGDDESGVPEADSFILKVLGQDVLLAVEAVAYFLVTREQRRIRLGGYVTIDGAISTFKKFQHWFVVAVTGVVLVLAVASAWTANTEQAAGDEAGWFTAGGDEILLMLVVIVELVVVLISLGLVLRRIVEHNRSHAAPDAVSYLGRGAANLKESQAAVIRLLRKQNEELSAQILRAEAAHSGRTDALSPDVISIDIKQLREELERSRENESRLQSQIHSLRAASNSSAQEARDLKRNLDEFREQCDILQVKLTSEQNLSRELSLRLEEAKYRAQEASDV
eukprot:gnl/Chilomastix_cuspidata/2576.p3 GENE.gnl/Chilomastix_cuspidata/2576~~gnl/Chilomastix_cuspidata/2576.p3  ORF type:complete len:354 (+),score=133.99 gnl/Chilomastix_cuspidata/2576:1745-2806(+)